MYNSLKKLGFGAMLLGWGIAAAPAQAQIHAVGAENEYADVIAQIGGKYVQAVAIESDPTTDPHDFELSPRVAQQIAGASLIVRNGAGYDDWAAKIIGAVPNSHREVINVQQLLGLPEDVANPHLWYDPRTMPKVAAAIAAALARLQPEHAAVFQTNLRIFEKSLGAWQEAIAALKHDYPTAGIAATEPVGNYLVQAAGIAIKTPFSLQAAIMNGTDPAPQDVTTQTELFSGHQVQAFLYNQQVTSPLTQTFLGDARKANIPIVGVYETMPLGYHYQSWMLAETDAMRRAFANHTSTLTLQAASQPHG